MLYTSTLPLPPKDEQHARDDEPNEILAARLQRSPEWWVERTRGLDFSVIDAVELRSVQPDPLGGDHRVTAPTRPSAAAST